MWRVIVKEESRRNLPVNSSSQFRRALAKSPILWGALVCSGFYGLIHAGFADGPGISQYFNVRQYFTAHPVEYAATAMFFVGLAALAVKLLEIAVQKGRLGRRLLAPIEPGGQPVEDCRELAAELNRLPGATHDDYLVRRLRNALEYVQRSGQADGLEEELRYLADVDAGRLYGSYGLVRVIIWAIPILGFLGTVIGITLAIGKLSPEALETSLPAVMTNLSVAFYTTTQALALSIVLMFAQFLTDRRENALLTEVDDRAEAEMVGRFARVASGADGQLAAIGRMTEAMIESSERLVDRQCELWSSTIQAAQHRWSKMTDAAGGELQTSLSRALAASLKDHAERLTANELLLAEKGRESWQETQRSLIDNTETIAGLRDAVLQEARLLGRAVEATGQVARLEETLNQNLAALAGSKNFEQTVMSLAAAIHLLNSRLGEMPSDAPRVQLEPLDETGQAA